jgi:putative nucleotidyltransferase with HDIG domain
MGLLEKKNYVHGSRPTIGILIDWLSNDFQVSILSGIYDSAKKNDLNLICFEGGVLKRPKTQDLHDYCRNIIYSFAYKNAVDGLIVLSASLGHEISNDELTDFFDSFAPIPVVSIARKVPNVPSVLVDNKKGLIDLLDHFVDVHHCERFVLLKGNDNDDDGRERHNTFFEFMKNRNLPVDENLILEGNFHSSDAEKELAKLFGRGKIDFNAIVSMSDDMAFGAMKLCKMQGLSIPKDFLISGFDDVRQSSIVEPQLTTVKQPLRDLGVTALDILMRKMGGEAVAMETIIPTALVIRESCGCEPHYIFQVNMNSDKKPDGVPNEAETIERITRLIDRLLIDRLERTTEEIARDLYIKLSTAIRAGGKETFLRTWETVLQELYINFDYKLVIDSILQELCIVASSIQKENRTDNLVGELIEDATELLKKRAVKLEQQLSFEFIHNFHVLSDLRDALIATQTVAQFSRALESKLIILGIEEFYLALYHEGSVGPDGFSKLLFGIHEKKLLSLKDYHDCFPSRNLLPDGLVPKDERFAFHIDSLNYTNHLFGFIVFGLNPNYGVTYSNLRRIVSNALYGSYLFKRVKRHHNRLKLQKEELNASVEKYHIAMAGFINTLVKTIEVRDPYTAGHQRRVSDLARTIAEELGLSNELIETIRMAAIIHDLGKIYIPAEILNKPGEILDIEFNLIKNHPKIAYDILRSINFPWPIADVVFQHHERLNGSGYPSGLKGADIALPARIISVADVVEAMGSRRPYREALGIDKALEEITTQKGILYDANAVDICIQLFTKDGYKLKIE